MFLISEIINHVRRNKGRSFLVCGVAALLISCITLYSGNILNNETMLQNLSQAIPVTMQVVGRSGTEQIGLEIDTKHLDALLSSDIKNPLYTALAGGNIEKENQIGAIKSCDTQIIGVNKIAALSSSVTKEQVSFIDGWDEDAFADTKSVCIVSEAYAARHHVSLGDTLNFPLYVLSYNSDEITFHFVEVEEASLQVVGTYELGETITAEANNMVVPVNWLRPFIENQDIDFNYSSFQCTVRDPLQLNKFKADMREKHFKEVNSDSPEERIGDALQINDKLFIQAADGIQQNLDIFRWFQVPFYALVVIIIIFVLFLILRSSRTDMAIAISLGRTKGMCAVRYFCENILLMLLGGIIVLPMLIGVTGIGLWEIITIYMMFLICACIGIFIALYLLLRFDTLAMLTKID